MNADKLATAKMLRRAPTAEESLLWERLRTNRLHGIHFRRQQVIDGYVVDFYCHSAGLVIEVDGPVHIGQQEQDAYRERVISARGLTVLRIRNEEVRTDLDSVLSRILSFCRNNSPSL
jgi:very-short-patch-repair endonuclease